MLDEAMDVVLGHVMVQQLGARKAVLWGPKKVTQWG